jgi:fumarate reductase flavoprotein subunit
MHDKENAETLVTEIVVVGGGVAGLCAALAAAEAGVDVLLIEKQEKIGGSTRLSGGFFSFAGTPLQRESGVFDTSDMLFNDLLELSGNLARPDLVRAYCAGQGELYQWLVNHGIEFTSVETSSGQALPRSHKTDSKKMVAALRERAEASGRVTILTGVSAQRLLRENGDDRVVGLVANARQGAVHTLASRAVILSTGGFSRSEKLLAIFAPHLAGAMRHGGQGSTGDGLLMAWKLGADMCDMGQVKATFGTHPQTGPDRHEIVLACYLGAVIVNCDGKRFVDESKSYKTLGDACLEQAGGLAFQIFDQRIMDKSRPGVGTYDLALPIERGLMLKADTLKELAALCNIEPPVLVRTIANYNAAVNIGNDAEFGRDGLCHHTGDLVTIEAAPFYAYPSTSFISSTYCGLTIDAQARVLDVFGEPIRGLYAAGELTGGFHGKAYMTGSSLGKGAFFGRVAGAAAAR